MIHAVLVLAAVALGASACVVHPVGYRGHHGGWRGPGHAHAMPQAGWGRGARW
jgi:hypothetical protein